MQAVFFCLPLFLAAQLGHPHSGRGYKSCVPMSTTVLKGEEPRCGGGEGSVTNQRPGTLSLTFLNGSVVLVWFGFLLF